jgi:hypothetical protein
VSPPAAHGTIILMARSGYWALAGVTMNAAQTAASNDLMTLCTMTLPWLAS